MLAPFRLGVIAAAIRVATGGGGTVVDPNFADVVLLLHGDGANNSTTIVDSGPIGHSATAVGNAKISNAQSKFGGTSIAFDGSGDSLSIPDSTAFDLPADYTIEMWLFLTAYSSSGAFLLHHIDGLELFLLTNGRLFMNMNATTSLVTTGAGAVAAGAWTHIAVTREGNTYKIFVNGVLQASATSASGPVNTSGSLVVGNYTSGSYGLDGYIDELRITKGVARYSANFTPPAAPFPDA